jgi:hypothetical protein
MQTHQKKRLLWRLCGGLLTSTSGLILICLPNWEISAYIPLSIALGLAGITLCMIGMRLFLVAAGDDEPIQVTGSELGNIQLNGCCLVAYESESVDGKRQFRLASSRPLSPKREAALIRYLAVEGFLVSLWPEMKERIEDEAGWAFLG